MIATATMPAVAYLRRSTDKQEQSIADQRSEIERYARERGFRIVREYVDDAISGTSADQRPGFQKMVADAPAGGFKAVIVWNSDRFSRGDVTETEHYRFLLRKAGVTVLSVTEDYLAREGIDGDVLRTVKQFQNRQYSISLSQNTLRGQISSVTAASDPGRPCPYGYDREIIGPDGTALYRVRFCPGRIREVYGRDGQLQAKYAKGQELLKPGKECKARLVLSTPERVHTVREIFRLCVDGLGFKGIADELNRRGVIGPRGDFWSFTTIKSMLENPVYQGDLVWNRRTEAKFYAVREGRADRMRPAQESARVSVTRREDWIVVPDAVPAIVDRETWQRAQVMARKRAAARGGIGHRDRCWLLTGVLLCGDCGHRYWGEPKRKGRVEGRAPVITNYYTCGGRRTHGKLICPTPAHIKAGDLESWVLGKLERLVLGDSAGTQAAIDRIVALLMNEDGSAAEVERLEGELRKVGETVAALTASIDPANLALLNDKLTQLRLRKEHLEQELAAARLASPSRDERTIRQWAKRQLAGLADALNGRRDDEARRVLGSYVERITLWPSTKRGEMALHPDCWALWRAMAPGKQHDRPERRSGGNEVEGMQPCLKLCLARGRDFFDVSFAVRDESFLPPPV